MLPECCCYLSTLMRGMQEGESDRPAGESRQTGEGGESWSPLSRRGPLLHPAPPASLVVSCFVRKA